MILRNVEWASIPDASRKEVRILEVSARAGGRVRHSHQDNNGLQDRSCWWGQSLKQKELKSRHRMERNHRFKEMIVIQLSKENIQGYGADFKGDMYIENPKESKNNITKEIELIKWS